jgi:hypothetical protein
VNSDHTPGEAFSGTLLRGLQNTAQRFSGTLCLRDSYLNARQSFWRHYSAEWRLEYRAPVGEGGGENWLSASVGGQFEDLLWGMGGPRGGAEVTPMALSFYFCGYLLSDLPRAQLTAKALRMMYAPAAAYPEGAPAICPKTGAFHFGTALALEVRTLEMIAGVPDDVGTIEIGAHATALRSNSASRTRPRRP